jgi:hypothetical protein
MVNYLVVDLAAREMSQMKTTFFSISYNEGGHDVS